MAEKNIKLKDGEDILYPQTEFTNILNKPTTLSGYNISDAYTKTEIDSKVIPVSKGGTGATNTTDAINNLGIKTSSTVFYWNPVVKAGTWSRICYLYGTGTVGEAGILNFRTTWNCCVCNAIFAIVGSHNCKSSITQLCNTSYSNFAIRSLTNGNGALYIDINVPSNGLEDTVDVGYASFLPLSQLTNGAEYYTSFTDGTTIPSGYTVGSSFTTTSGATMRATAFNTY